jgi:hypothetical protein
VHYNLLERDVVQEATGSYSRKSGVVDFQLLADTVRVERIHDPSSLDLIPCPVQFGQEERHPCGVQRWVRMGPCVARPRTERQLSNGLLNPKQLFYQGVLLLPRKLWVDGVQIVSRQVSDDHEREGPVGGMRIMAQQTRQRNALRLESAQLVRCVSWSIECIHSNYQGEQLQPPASVSPAPDGKSVAGGRSRGSNS